MNELEGCLQKNAALLEEVGAFARKANGNLFDLPALDMRVEPGLVRPGEGVVVRLFAKGANPPAGQLTMEADYLGRNQAQPRGLQVDWRKAGEGDWRAECKLIADCAGNWRFVWVAEGHRLSRILGVVEPGKVVVTLWVGSNIPRLDREIHQYDLPGDHWVGSGFGMPPEKIVRELKPFVMDAFHYGDRLAPICNADALFPGIKDKNLFKAPLDEQRRAILQLQAMWRILGLKELEIFGCYTPGHATFGLLAELGFKALNSLCVWQNWLDGHSAADWQINHVGCPISPYYPAPDDFRKVAAGRALVAFSMGTASSIRCYDLSYDGCPSNCMGHIRYWRLPGVGSNVHRFFAAVDGWIHDARNNREPVFATVGLENFYNCLESRRANEEGVHYLVRRAGEGKLLFASSADIADFYQRHYPVQPEHVHFQPDYMLGTRAWSKPARLPDRIELVNRQFHSLHMDGEALPQFLWDHTIRWENPEWDDQKAWRNPFGLVTPETVAATVNPEACVPRQTDLRGVRVVMEMTPEPAGIRVMARVRSAAKIDSLPLALWRIPLDADREISAEGLPPHVRWLPVRDGWSGNLHGILVLTQVPSGESEWVLRLSGPTKPAASIDIGMNGLLAGRTMRMTEEVRTYLWRENPDCRLKVTVRIPPGSPISAMYLDGTTVGADAAGGLEVLLDEHWSHEAPTLIHGVPEPCGRDAVLAIRQVQPIRTTPHVKDWWVSQVMPMTGSMEALAYPEDKAALRFTQHRIPGDFASLNLDRLKDHEKSSVVYQMARFQTSGRAQICADLGYDGPVKAWLDGRLLFQYPRGISPWAIEARPGFEAGAGEHEVLTAFSNHGACAWGVRLRILSLGEEVPLARHLSAPILPPEIMIL